MQVLGSDSEPKGRKAKCWGGAVVTRPVQEGRDRNRGGSGSTSLLRPRHGKGRHIKLQRMSLIEHGRLWGWERGKEGAGGERNETSGCHRGGAAMGLPAK